ncbi:MAG: tetratricopeptide repeat protein [Vicinamibacterales bacterium]
MSTVTHLALLCLGLASLAVAQTPDASAPSPIQERRLTLEQKSPDAAPAGIPRGYAVVIGVSTYPNLDASRQLKYAESDARAVYRSLISKEAGAFPAENVHMLLGAQATLANITFELETWLPGQATESDRVVVYFAGHGFVERGRAYFAPYDVEPGRLGATGYSMTTMGDVMARRVKARWKVLLADACHSAKINAETTSEALDQQFSSLPQNFLTLTSTTEREASHEDAALSTGFGLFTYFLTQAFVGTADNDPCDGRITADELIEYVRANVRRYAKDRGLSQTPTPRGDYDPDMLLGVSSTCMNRDSSVAPPLVGTAVVEVNLDEVDLYIDDRLIGRLSKDKPLRVPGLSVGPHEFRAVRSGYEPDVKTILIAPGQDVAVTLRIRYARTIRRSALDLGAQGERILSSLRSSMNPANILPIARKQSEADLLRARALFEQALAEEPAYSVAAYHLGEVNQLLGDYPASLKALRRAIDSDRGYVEARTQYAAVLTETGDTEQAIRELTEALRLEPDNDDLHAMMARAFFDRGSWKQAIDESDTAIALNESNAMAQLWRADALRQLGAVEKDASLRTAYFVQAREGFRSFLNLTNFESSRISLLAFHFIGHGIGSRRHADREEAYKGLRTAGYSGLCITEARVGHLQRARDYCERALRYDEDNAITRFLLANVNRDLYNSFGSCAYLIAAARQYARMVDLNPDLQESKNAKNYLEQITALAPKAGCLL